MVLLIIVCLTTNNMCINSIYKNLYSCHFYSCYYYVFLWVKRISSKTQKKNVSLCYLGRFLRWKESLHEHQSDVSISCLSSVTITFDKPDNHDVNYIHQRNMRFGIIDARTILLMISLISHGFVWPLYVQSIAMSFDFPVAGPILHRAWKLLTHR